VTPQYAKYEDGKILINEGGLWTPKTPFFAKMFAIELRHLSETAHAVQIAELNAALEGRPHK